jgi:hypothetical protein
MAPTGFGAGRLEAAKNFGNPFCLAPSIAVSAPLPIPTASAVSCFRDNALTCREFLGTPT